MNTSSLKGPSLADALAALFRPLTPRLVDPDPGARVWYVADVLAHRVGWAP